MSQCYNSISKNIFTTMRLNGDRPCNYHKTRLGGKHMYKKIFAPIVITSFLVLYYMGFAYFVLFADDIPLILKLFAGVIPLCFIGVCIYVLVERIREIRSGEEDDLSKY